MASNTGPAATDDLNFLSSGGEMGALMRAHDWSRTSVGAPSGWPQALRTAVRLMLNCGHPMYIFWGTDGACFYNDAYRLSIGPERHPGSLGLPAFDVWSEIWDIIGPQIAQVMAGEGATWHENALVPITRNGRLEDVYWTYSYSPIDDQTAANGVGGVLVVCTETTQAVLTQQRGVAEQERQRRLFEQAPGFIVIMSGPEHVVEFVNDRHRTMFHSASWLGKDMRTAFPSIAGQGFYELLDKVYTTGETIKFDATEVRFRKGPEAPEEARFLTFIYAPLFNDQQEIIGVFCEGFDVTEGHVAETHTLALAELGERIRDIDDPDELAYAAAEILGRTLGVSRAGYGTIDKANETISIERDWNMPGVQSLAGTLNFRDYGSYIEDLKSGVTVVVSDAEKDPRTAPTAGALKAISAQSFVNMPVTEQGGFAALLYLNHAEAREWSERELGLIRDVAERTRTAVERRRAELALRASEESFRTLARAMPNQAWTATPDGMLDWFNKQVFDYSGAVLSEIEGAGWATYVHPDDSPDLAARWEHALRTGETYEASFRLRRRDGAYRWHISRAVANRENGEITRWIGTNTDIHDQKEIAQALADLNLTLEQRVEERTSRLMVAEEALRQSQKMEAVGQLTGGIAHDFNNLLGGISGSLELLDKRLAEGRRDGLERYIASAKESSRRAASLTQRLLAFSRRQTLAPKAVDVNKLVAGMEDLIRRTVGPTITVEVVGAGGLWTTKIDPSQLENSLLNLCINARDAMAPNGGRVTIETANKWLDDRAAQDRDLLPGQYVSLCVTDTGAGMSEEVIERAFDPFFTTKPLGEGTGLGLSMVYGFVRQSGGQVRIYSEIGKGTTMCLYLPRYHGPAEQPEAEPGALPAEHGDGEAVLVIDDEPILRMLITDVLLENGYRAIEAVDGASGLQVLMSDQRIDLLITDVGLPGGMNGRQVADAARQQRPDLKVLFITGYAENAVVGNGHLDPGMEVMTKPFVIANLARKIRDMIDR